MPLIPSRTHTGHTRIPRPAGKPALPKWIEMKLAIPVLGGAASSKDVNGFRLGILFVHPGIGVADRGKFAVTHVTSGSRILFVATEAEAKRIAEHLWATCRDALTQSVPSEVCRRLPKWAVPWCKKCQEVLAWADPKEFQS